MNSIFRYQSISSNYTLSPSSSLQPLTDLMYRIPQYKFSIIIFPISWSIHVTKPSSWGSIKKTCPPPPLLPPNPCLRVPKIFILAHHTDTERSVHKAKQKRNSRQRKRTRSATFKGNAILLTYCIFIVFWITIGIYSPNSRLHPMICWKICKFYAKFRDN